MSTPTVRRLLRTDGTSCDLQNPISTRAAAALIGAKDLGTVNLKHMGRPLHVMLVDDAGYDSDTETTHLEGGAIHLEIVPRLARLPVNVEATRLYHLNCIPGTTHKIVGDVVIVPDDDFADDGLYDRPTRPVSTDPLPLASELLAIANAAHLPREHPVWKLCIDALCKAGQAFHIHGNRQGQTIYVYSSEEGESCTRFRGASAFVARSELAILTGRRAFRVLKHRETDAGHMDYIEKLPAFIEQYRALHWPVPAAADGSV